MTREFLFFLNGINFNRSSLPALPFLLHEFFAHIILYSAHVKKWIHQRITYRIFDVITVYYWKWHKHNNDFAIQIFPLQNTTSGLKRSMVWEEYVHRTFFAENLVHVLYCIAWLFSLEFVQNTAGSAPNFWPIKLYLWACRHYWIGNVTYSCTALLDPSLL